MKMYWRQIILLSASTALAIAGMGSSCPGTGSTANFNNALLLAERPTVAPVRSWHQSMIIDPGVTNPADPTIDNDQNVVVTGVATSVSIFPTAVFHDADEQFYAIFTRGTNPPPAVTGNVNVFATEQNTFSSDSWVTGFGSFTQLDVSTSTMSFQVKTQVDTGGNATAYFNATSPITNPPTVGGAAKVLKSAHHSFGNGTWDAPITISDAAAGPLTLTTATTAGFTVPLANNLATVNIAVGSSTGYPAPGVVFIVGAGYFNITTVPDGTHVTVTNPGTVGNAAPATVIANPATVSVSNSPSHPGNTNDVGNSTASATDAFGNTVVVWVQPSVAHNTEVFFNEFRPNLGWRFSSVNPVVAWNGLTVFDPVLDRGVDVGFDSFGNGYGLYVATLSTPGFAGRNAIVSARWRNDKPENFPICDPAFGGVSDCNDIVPITDGPHATAHTVFGYPRVYVGLGGQATAFWYENQSGQFAELWTSQAVANTPASAPSAGIWGAPVRFDLAFGGAATKVYMNETSHFFIIAPILAYDGDFAALGTIKSDGAVRRLFVSSSSNGGSTWNQLGPADLGGFPRNVEAANISVNKRGDIAVTYSATDPADFREHVYGNVFTLGGWTGVVQLDTNTATLAFARPNYSLPNVSIDEQGNACVVYSISDILFSPQRRRVQANFYR